MTNEERAKQLTGFDINLYEMHKNSADNRDEHDKDCYEIALEMAKWKDQQFKKCLETKKTEILFEKIAPMPMVLEKAEVIDEIIDELFGEIENVNHSNSDE